MTEASGYMSVGEQRGDMSATMRLGGGMYEVDSQHLPSETMRDFVVQDIRSKSQALEATSRSCISTSTDEANMQGMVVYISPRSLM